MFVAYLIYMTFDIFVIMYLGSEIKFSSDRLSYCLFESNWIEQSQKCKKCIIILAEMLQQPHELVIVTYQLNLETFTTVNFNIQLGLISLFITDNFYRS